MSGKQKGANIVMVITIILSIATIACVGIILFYVGYGTNDKEYSIEEIVGIYDSHTEEIYYDDQYNKLIEEKRLVITNDRDGKCVGTATIRKIGYGRYYDQSQSQEVLYQGEVVLSEKHISIGKHVGYIKTKTIKATETENKKRIREITIEGVTYRANIY